jgi:hypothetical protein
MKIGTLHVEEPGQQLVDVEPSVGDTYAAIGSGGIRFGHVPDTDGVVAHRDRL